MPYCHIKPEVIVYKRGQIPHIEQHSKPCRLKKSEPASLRNKALYKHYYSGGNSYHHKYRADDMRLEHTCAAKRQNPPLFLITLQQAEQPVNNEREKHHRKRFAERGSVAQVYNSPGRQGVHYRGKDPGIDRL